MNDGTKKRRSEHEKSIGFQEMARNCVNLALFFRGFEEALHNMCLKEPGNKAGLAAKFCFVSKESVGVQYIEPLLMPKVEEL